MTIATYLFGALATFMFVLSFTSLSMAWYQLQRAKMLSLGDVVMMTLLVYGCILLFVLFFRGMA